MYTLRQMFQLISGIFLLVLGLGFFGVLSTVNILECQRDSNSCSLTRQSLFGQRQRSISLNEFQRVELITIERPRLWLSPQRSYIIELHTSLGSVPLSPHPSSNQQSRQQLTQQIIQFLEDPQQAQLRVEIDDRLGFSIAGTLVVICAITLIYSSSRRLPTNKP